MAISYYKYMAVPDSGFSFILTTIPIQPSLYSLWTHICPFNRIFQHTPAGSYGPLLCEAGLRLLTGRMHAGTKRHHLSACRVALPLLHYYNYPDHDVAGIKLPSLLSSSDRPEFCLCKALFPFNLGHFLTMWPTSPQLWHLR